MVRTVRKIDPAIAVYLAERFKSPMVQSEVGKLVRSSSLDFLDIPEALHFLVGDKVDLNVQRDLKVYRHLCLTSLADRISRTCSCGHPCHLLLQSHFLNDGTTMIL